VEPEIVVPSFGDVTVTTAGDDGRVPDTEAGAAVVAEARAFAEASPVEDATTLGATDTPGETATLGVAFAPGVTEEVEAAPALHETVAAISATETASRRARVVNRFTAPSPE
jgi:hypothetical protein